MIKLKELINELTAMTPMNHAEWYPAHTRDALEWSLNQNYVPLYPKQVESLFGKVPVNSFHVTNPENISSLSKVLGKKKSISTFTKANKSSGLAKGRGVQTGSGGVIFYIEGLLLGRKWQDFETVPDRTGRRWVQSRFLFDGDNMIVQDAIKKAGLPNRGEWSDIEWEVEKKHTMGDYDSFKDYNAAIKKELGPMVQKHLKKYIDVTNGLLKTHKDKVQKSVREKSTENSSWWNEILVYDTKVIDAFVLKRVYEDYYFQNDSQTSTIDKATDSYKKELLKIVPENKVTVGSPAQFRKWYTSREGEITI